MRKNATWRCKICGGYASKDTRIKHIFCSIQCAQQEQLVCHGCGELFYIWPHDRTRKYCDECRAMVDRILYSRRLVEKKCRDCGKDIIVTDKTILCKECLKISDANHHYQIVSRSIICPKCGKTLYTERINKTRNVLDNKKNTRMCEDCKREREERKLEKRKQFLEFYRNIRKRLWRWRIDIIEKYEGRCARCGKGEKDGITLNVHHLKPLRKIIHEVFKKYELSKICDIVKFGEIENIAQEIVRAHTLEIGILYCEQCHGEEDKAFVQYKNKTPQKESYAAGNHRKRDIQDRQES